MSRRVVEPASVAGQHQYPVGSERVRPIERELEVGCIFLRGVSLDPRSARLRASNSRRRGRVEVAHSDRDLEPERKRVLEPFVCRDHLRPERHGKRGPRIGRSPACDNHYDFVGHAFLRWHYPDQVPRVGGALSRPLSPVARAPRTLLAS